MLLALLDWMVWTSGTVAFAFTVFASLIAMTVLAILVPSTPRKGFLPIATARGDRIYISLLGTGLVMVLFVVLTDLPLPVGLALAVLLFVVPVLVWG